MDLSDKSLFITFVLLMLSQYSFSQNIDSSFSAYNYSLWDLQNIKITTGSLKAENSEVAPSNITIITEQMIADRGYQTLVDVCQDIPGFDFKIFNDAGGDYPTYSMNRGLGDVGNPEILIMIDGIVQNNISFNWSLLWSYETMLVDVDRIEVILGPGSVVYGAQAFTGVIHIITKENYSGAKAMTFFGSNMTHGAEVQLGTKLGKETHLSMAFHDFHTEGDKGLNRYDPGGYFKNNIYPDTILSDYDRGGNYIENSANPMGGKRIPDGFSTQNHNYAFRSKMSYKNTEIGFFMSETVQAYGSAIAAYEYDLTEMNNTTDYKSYHIYAKNRTNILPNVKLNSALVFRGTHIISDGGFKYLYRFPDLTKNYQAYAYQGYIEANLVYEANNNNDFSIGAKAALSQKSDRIVSLGGLPDSKYTTNYSWDIAETGGGFNQFQAYPIFFVKEAAIFGLWDKQWLKNLSSSAGLRYDFSSEYGSIFNPRLALDYNLKSLFGAKLLFGTAFRQPSVFELNSEFRGNPNLLPQRIRTSELELYSRFLDDRISLKTNVFYSNVKQFIGKVPDNNMPSGERYENIDEIKISGVAFYLSSQLQKNVRIYSNYNFLTGLNKDTYSFYDIESTAKNKINAGINIKTFQSKFIIDYRMNFVGKRKAHSDNTWLQIYKNGYAPSYWKANLVLTWKLSSSITTQVIVKNLFNEQYYGVGREAGSAFINDYDYRNNVNPSGFIPAYHPQPGRTFLIKLIYLLPKNS